MNAEVVLKSTRALTQVSGDVVNLDAPSIVRLDLARANVAAMERQGSDLVVRMTTGEQVRVANFYPNGGAIAPNDLVLRETDGTLWQARATNGIPRFSGLQNLDDLLAAQAAAGGGSSLALPAALLGGVAAAGAAAAAAGGGGDDGNTGNATPSEPAPGTGGTTPGGTVPDREAPAAPTATVGGDGAQVAGRGESGATVQVRDAGGAVIGNGVVGTDGAYTVTLSPARIAGGSLIVTQTDAAGNVSPGTSAQAPDLTAPSAPTVEIDAAGATITGRGEAGATVTIRDASGTVIATATVGTDGGYAVTLSPVQANGGTLSVAQTDPAGNISSATAISVPDTTAPAAPTAAISADGSVVSGSGEAGARITVVDGAGTVIGTATVGADGTYAAPLSPAQANGETVTVGQSDAAGNLSPGVTAVAPDLTAPAAPVAALDATGSIVSGNGEPGARISVSDASGGEIGTATVDARGNYNVVLSTPQVDSQTLVVTQADAAGNVSPATPLAAPDITAPAAPTATVAGDGASIAGTGEAGATITIRSPVGAIVGSAVVAADGSYAVALSPAQTDGEVLIVRQADPAGNVSPPANAVAPDLVAGVGPDAPTAAVSADGTIVTGTAAAGATVTLYDANGVVIGTGIAAADGGYGVALTPARLDGETIRVTQTDGNGEVSPPATAFAPDLTAPGTPVATIDATGAVVTGTGQAGATVTVRTVDGIVVGTAVVASNGAFAVPLSPLQTDGTTVAVTQADAAGNVSSPLSLTAPDLDVPLAPSALVSADGGAVTGNGEAGTTVTVRDESGVVVGTGTVGADGSFTVPITPAQANGETLNVTVSDAGGNVSPATVVTAPDITDPLAPVAQITVDGTIVTGTGEAGATVTVRNAADVVVGTAPVAADGSYTVVLTQAQTNAETLSVTQVDAAGNASTPAGLTAPDTTAPASPTGFITGDGVTVNGTGEPGASIVITGVANAVIGTAVVDADGNYSALLSPAQANGEALRVVQTDAAGNASVASPLTAPDITPPAAPVATLDATGAVVTGTGEAGAIVTVSSGGTVLGSATVTAQGTYSVTLSTPQIDSQALSVTQRDGAGNVSAATGLTGPDLTAPASPVAAITGDGASVSGTGEPGARIAITNVAGTVVGTAVVDVDGNYSAPLNPAQANGEALRVVQTDAAGNASVASPLTAPDITPPAAPVATLDATGAVVTGTGEAGAIVTVSSSGTILGTATVTAQGNYSVTLSTPQIDSQALSVTQRDDMGNLSPATSLNGPDLTAPDAPNAQIDAAGDVLTGSGEAGATVVVRDPLGIVVGTTIVNPDGSYVVALAPAQTDGEVLGVRQTDAAGNVSPEASVTAPDLVTNVAPDAPTAAVSADGASVSGSAIGGASITCYDAVGTVIGTGVANPDGSYSVVLASARVDGEIVRVTQTEADGDVSPPATAIAPDLTAPAAPTAVLDGTGDVVTGTGQPGATITIRAADDVTVLGTATVGTNGAYATTLTTPQVNGELLSAVQSDAANNTSPPISLLAPDFTPPAIPVAQIAGDGGTVTGTGEAGATVTVRDAANVVVGTATVAVDGSFSATLTPAQANGGTISVVQADLAGNVSAPVPLAAPDITAPAAPIAQIAGDGMTVTGTGEAGASVTISVGAVTVTTQVAANGSFAATLNPAQVNGETITVTQTDAAGNGSAPVTILAPDLVAPVAPTATVAVDGASVVGTGEAGARIVVTDAGGVVVGLAIVAVDGSYSAPLDPPLLNGERLNATQTDGGGNVSPPVLTIAPDVTAPTIPTLVIANDGATASGVGEAGAIVTLRNPDGSVIGSVQAAADGSFAFALTPPRLDGQVLSVTQADARGNVSPTAFDAAPDTTAPSAPSAMVATDGRSVQGTGEAGATVTVRGPGNTPLGSVVVAADGSYTVALTSVQGNGQALQVSQSDASGNASAATPARAPDFTNPAAPSANIAPGGASVSGIGEAGATVTILGPTGSPLGSSVVAADGSYTVALSTPQTNGELLGASQRDAAGNGSPTTSVLAADTTAPGAPLAVVSGDGNSVTGRGEPGATVTVTGSNGVSLGTATVAAAGTYAVQLSQTQLDGQTLTVRLTDRAGNVSLPSNPVAPDGTAPLAPTASITTDGSAAVGIGVRGSTITVTNAAGVVVGTAIVADDGSYIAPLSPAQRNGELLSVVQADAAHNVSAAIPAVAPDLTPPPAPAAVVASEGNVVTGTGEAGATVVIKTLAGAVLGTAVVGPTGSYVVNLQTPQRNGESVVATQVDAAGNVSGGTTVVAPDLTAPPPPTISAIAGDGTVLTGRGEAGAHVEVRAPDSTLLGATTVNADGSFVIALSPAQTAGATLTVTQADAAGNLSLPSTIVAPFDISAFGNADTAAIDLVPATRAVSLGQAAYLALVSLNVVNLQAEVLTTGNVRFSVAQGHSLDATFTFDTLVDLSIAGSYAVVVQRFENGQWVAVNGNGAASLLDISILNGNIVATDTLGPGEYRAFATVQGGGAGVALLSSLTVTGVDADYTDVAGINPVAATGNVITEPGPNGELDIVGPGTHVFSVTVNGITTAVAAGGTSVAGAWGTLTINPDGSYTYVPTATAATIGQTDVFTYTLIDPTDGELASANLSIAIGSPDITGAPIAVADHTFADVTFQNVVSTVAPAQAFNFNASATGSGNGSFTIAPNATSDISIIADRLPALGLSVLPQYTVTIRNTGTGSIVIASATALANGVLGTSAFTFQDLPSGNYTYTVASRSALALGSFTTSVSIGSTTTYLDQHTLATAETATGHLFDNDSANTSFASIRVNTPSGFTEVGETPITLTGLHGTLTVDETGGYVYHPSATLPYSTVDLTDSFTYQLVQPNGVSSTATLTVTIDVPGDGPASAVAAASVMSLAHFIGDDGAIPLDALTGHTGDSASVAPHAAAVSLAAYDLFEGRGELEDVLSHYLADQHTAAPADTAETVHPAAIEPTAAAPIEDPFNFLATIPDQDHPGTVTNHVV